MFKKAISQFAEFDWYLIINILLLMFFGLVILYSLQINVSDPDFATLQRKIIFVVIGLILFFLVSLINYRFWGDYYKLILIGMVVILLGVIISGTTIRGVKAWLTFYGQTIQPVEFAKLALVIFLARYFSLTAKGPALLKSVFVSGLVTLTIIILVVLQPDLGSAMILFLTWLIFVLLLPLSGKKVLSILLIIVSINESTSLGGIFPMSILKILF